MRGVRKICGRKQFTILAAAGVTFMVGLMNLQAEVPTGSPLGATNYYKFLSQKLNFSTTNEIFETKLDDVAAYFGYNGFTGRDLQNTPPGLLMSPNLLLELARLPAGARLFDQPDNIASNLITSPIEVGDVLSTRFFAPKIMNISLPEETW